MSIFEEYKNLQEEYKYSEYKCIDDSYFDDDLLKSNRKTQLRSIKKLEINLKTCKDVRENYFNIVYKIITFSKISASEARCVFPDLLSHWSEEKYFVKVIQIDGKDYLTLCPVEYLDGLEIDLNDKNIILLGENDYSTGFKLYSLSPVDDEYLDDFTSQNADSELLSNISNFVNTYIDYKNDGKVKNWIEFYEKYYFTGEFIDYNERINGNKHRHDKKSKRKKMKLENQVKMHIESNK